MTSRMTILLLRQHALLFLLDITGSMSNSLEGAKSAMQQLVHMCSQQLQDHPGQLRECLHHLHRV